MSEGEREKEKEGIRLAGADDSCSQQSVVLGRAMSLETGSPSFSRVGDSGSR